VWKHISSCCSCAVLVKWLTIIVSSVCEVYQILSYCRKSFLFFLDRMQKLSRNTSVMWFIVTSFCCQLHIWCWVMYMVTDVLTCSGLRVQVILLSSLKEPVPRLIYDQVARSSLMEPLLDCLHNRHLLRQSVCRHDREAVYPEVSDSLATLIRKLTSQGMTVDIEEKLVVSCPCWAWMLQLSKL